MAGAITLGSGGGGATTYIGQGTPGQGNAGGSGYAYCTGAVVTIPSGSVWAII